MSLQFLAPAAAVIAAILLSSCKPEETPPPPPRAARVIEAVPAPLLLAAEGSGTIASRTNTSCRFSRRWPSRHPRRRCRRYGDRGRDGRCRDRPDRLSRTSSIRRRARSMPPKPRSRRPRPRRPRSASSSRRASPPNPNTTRRSRRCRPPRPTSPRRRPMSASPRTSWLHHAEIACGGRVTRTGRRSGPGRPGGPDDRRDRRYRRARRSVLGSCADRQSRQDRRQGVRSGCSRTRTSRSPARCARSRRMPTRPPAPTRSRLRSRIRRPTCASASLVRGRAEQLGSDVVSIPPTALVQTGDEPQVWIVSADGTVHLTPVTVARYDTDAVMISKGIAKGDLVVIAGVNSLAEGQVVKVEKVADPMKGHNLSAWAIQASGPHPLLHAAAPGGGRFAYAILGREEDPELSRSTPWWFRRRGPAPPSSTP